MTKNNFPETSREAYNSLHPETQRKMYDKIIAALKVLGVAHYEDLSDYLGCQDRNQISRRLKEMEGLQLIWKPGGKKLTKRGRNAFVYQLTSESSPKTEATEKVMKGDSIADISRNMAKIGDKHQMQPTLF